MTTHTVELVTLARDLLASGQVPGAKTEADVLVWLREQLTPRTIAGSSARFNIPAPEWRAPLSG